VITTVSAGECFFNHTKGIEDQAALSPPPIDGCPILRVLCEGWDTQISLFNLPRKADLFRRRPGFLLARGHICLRIFSGFTGCAGDSVVEEHGFSRVSMSLRLT
jgi:hypothetical protein